MIFEVVISTEEVAIEVGSELFGLVVSFGSNAVDGPLTELGVG